MKRKVGISTPFLQTKFGDEEALRISKSIGADAVDICTILSCHDYRKSDTVYNKSNDEIYSYYRNLKKVCR